MELYQPIRCRYPSFASSLRILTVEQNLSGNCYLPTSGRGEPDCRISAFDETHCGNRFLSSHNAHFLTFFREELIGPSRGWEEIGRWLYHSAKSRRNLRINTRNRPLEKRYSWILWQPCSRMRFIFTSNFICL